MFDLKLLDIKQTAGEAWVQGIVTGCLGDLLNARPLKRLPDRTLKAHGPGGGSGVGVYMEWVGA